MQLQIVATPSVLCCHLAIYTVGSTCYSNFVFCKITLVLVGTCFHFCVLRLWTWKQICCDCDKSK